MGPTTTVGTSTEYDRCQDATKAPASEETGALHITAEKAMSILGENLEEHSYHHGSTKPCIDCMNAYADRLGIPGD